MPLQIKVHVKATVQRLTGQAPFGDQSGLRELGVQLLPDFLVNGLGVGAVRRVVLHQRAGHIHSEAVATPLQPELHDVPQGSPGGQGLRAAGRLLPGLVTLAVAVV